MANRDATRRTFMATGAAALLCAPAGGKLSTPVIDTHIHLYDPARPQGVPWPAKTDTLLYRRVLPAEYASLVRPFGVTGAIVIEASPWLEDNQWVLDLAKDNPIIAGLVGHLEPGAESYRQHLARFSKDPLFRGIRLNSKTILAGLQSRAFIEDLKRLAGAGLMMDAIGGADMLPALLSLTDSVPNLRIAIDHMPNEPVGWQATENFRKLMTELAQRPQVYCKVSGVLKKEGDGYRDALDGLWRMFGEERVMYGSNWPVSDKVDAYPRVFGVVQDYVAPKGAPASAKFFGANSRTCYRWLDRG